MYVVPISMLSSVLSLLIHKPLPPRPGWWPTFTALFPASRTPPSCSLSTTGSPASSCSQHCELQCTHTHTHHTHSHTAHTHTHILSPLASPEFRMPPSAAEKTPSRGWRDGMQAAARLLTSTGQDISLEATALGLLSKECEIFLKLPPSNRPEQSYRGTYFLVETHNGSYTVRAMDRQSSRKTRLIASICMNVL